MRVDATANRDHMAQTLCLLRMHSADGDLSARVNSASAVSGVALAVQLPMRLAQLWDQCRALTQNGGCQTETVQRLPASGAARSSFQRSLG